MTVKINSLLYLCGLKKNHGRYVMAIWVVRDTKGGK